jgi:uncharacterized membrane protein YfcA
MDLARGAFLLGSSIAAGAINAVAGGGTLLSFPAAMAAGLSPVVANASNAVALTPGSLAAAWSYRGFLGDKKRLALWLALPATLGAVLGAMILRVTRPSVFEAIVPWLILGATLVILLQQLGVRWRAVTAANALTAAAAPTVKSAPLAAARARRRLLLVLFFQFLVGVYGGYFGGAMGIIMLAYLSLIGGMEIHQMNAIKNFLAGVVNGVASVYFIARGMVDARAAALMTAGAIVGGLVGARIARRIQPRVVRWIVIAIGLGLALIFALRGFGKS